MASMLNSKGTRIEVYTLTVDGLKPTIEFSIHGTIIALRLYTPQVTATTFFSVAKTAMVLKARFLLHSTGSRQGIALPHYFTTQVLRTLVRRIAADHH